MMLVLHFVEDKSNTITFIAENIYMSFNVSHFKVIYTFSLKYDFVHVK